MDDSRSPRTPDRLSELSSSHVQQLEVLRTMIGACGPYNLGGSVTASRADRAHAGDGSGSQRMAEPIRDVGGPQADAGPVSSPPTSPPARERAGRTPSP